MTETKYRLEVTQTATIGSDKTAELSFGPSNYGETWVIKRYVTSAPRAQSGSILEVYRNYVSQSTLIDSTLKAENDVGNLETTLLYGEKIWFKFYEGQPDDTVTIRLEGDRIIPGKRAY